MGSSASKGLRAAGGAARQYPTRPPPTSQAPLNNARQSPPPQDSAPGPNVRPPPQASTSKSEAVNLDASDPDFAQSLRTLGPVRPNPTMSPTSAFPHPSNPNNPGQAPRPAGPDPRTNPAIAVLDARSRLQDEAEREFIEAGRRGHPGREFLDVFTIRQMLILRDQRGKNAAEIEKALGLKQGAVDRLGAKGVVQLVHEIGRAEREVDMV